MKVAELKTKRNGPHNLPKPSHRKFVRKRAKLARKANRGAYSGR